MKQQPQQRECTRGSDLVCEGAHEGCGDDPDQAHKGRNPVCTQSAIQVKGVVDAAGRKLLKVCTGRIREREVSVLVTLLGMLFG